MPNPIEPDNVPEAAPESTVGPVVEAPVAEESKPKIFNVKITAEVIANGDAAHFMHDTLEMGSIDVPELQYLMGKYAEFRQVMQRDAEGNPALFYAD